MDRVTRVFEISSDAICNQSAQNKRKEKARIAARARRSQEASIIMEMANELHITQEKMRRIDKATIVKLAIDYIKAFEVLCRCRDPFKGRDYVILSRIQQYEQQQQQQMMIQQQLQRPQIIRPPPAQQIDQEQVKPTRQLRINQGQQPLGQLSHQICRPQLQQQQQQPQQQVRVIQRSRLQPIPQPQQTQRHLQPVQVQQPQVQLQMQQQQQQPLRQQQQQFAQPLGLRPLGVTNSMPKLSTTSIFAPKTQDMETDFLFNIENECDVKLSPNATTTCSSTSPMTSTTTTTTTTRITTKSWDYLDEEDLVHLAPQAGEIVPLDGPMNLMMSADSTNSSSSINTTTTANSNSMISGSQVSYKTSGSLLGSNSNSSSSSSFNDHHQYRPQQHQQLQFQLHQNHNQNVNVNRNHNLSANLLVTSGIPTQSATNYISAASNFANYI